MQPGPGLSLRRILVLNLINAIKAGFPPVVPELVRVMEYKIRPKTVAAAACQELLDRLFRGDYARMDIKRRSTRSSPYLSSRAIVNGTSVKLALPFLQN